MNIKNKKKKQLPIKECLKDLRRELKHLGLIADFGDGYLNISRPDGLNCEFYPCYATDYPGELYTARYTVDGKERDFDIEIPEEQDYFIEIVRKILDWKNS